ncbi:hypothetical protein ACIODS_12065 [Micromonospora chalcea]|uniref:hypothetical protein n=1 Tax=Micromonospora chalcea TaxID=1874 RepID=UPI003804BBA0
MTSTASQPAPLVQARTVPLDQLGRADTAAIVRRVLAAHTDRTRIPAAKFASFV